MKIKTFLKKMYAYVPLCLSITACIALIVLVLSIIASTDTAFAHTVNRYVGGVVRMVLAWVTGIFPFSLAEGLLLFSPVLLCILIALSVKYTKRGLRAGFRYLGVLLSILLLLYPMFVFGLGMGFSEPTLDEKFGIEKKPVSAEALYEAILWTMEEAAALCDEVTFAEDGSSYMPYDDYEDMCDDLMLGYARLYKEYPVFFNFPSRVKPVILSEPMSYTHITGIYTFFTGESNININFPDYTIPYTAAHELAHQRGFAREDEANFIAFLVCANANDPYTRYSAYINMTEYLSNALHSADLEIWKDAMRSLDTRLYGEMLAYNKFFEKYRDNPVEKVSSAANDAYLKSQGQSAGVQSYGLVVDLAVAYYNSKISD